MFGHEDWTIAESSLIKLSFSKIYNSRYCIFYPCPKCLFTLFSNSTFFSLNPFSYETSPMLFTTFSKLSTLTSPSPSLYVFIIARILSFTFSFVHTVRHNMNSRKSRPYLFYPLQSSNIFETKYGRVYRIVAFGHSFLSTSQYIFTSYENSSVFILKPSFCSNKLLSSFRSFSQMPVSFYKIFIC